MMKYYASVIHRLQRELVDAGIMSSQYLTEPVSPNIDFDETVESYIVFISYKDDAK